MKDSRELDDADREEILRVIKTAPEKYFVITHGTYTMPITAQFLAERLVGANKVIILTGSFVPLVGMSPSDGGFNLGCAVGIIDQLKPGVYVGMNGKIFTASKVQKDTAIGRFENKPN